jgi:hypothetical protein
MMFCRGVARNEKKVGVFIMTEKRHREELFSEYKWSGRMGKKMLCQDINLAAEGNRMGQ